MNFACDGTGGKKPVLLLSHLTQNLCHSIICRTGIRFVLREFNQGNKLIGLLWVIWCKIIVFKGKQCFFRLTDIVKQCGNTVFAQVFFVPKRITGTIIVKMIFLHIVIIVHGHFHRVGTLIFVPNFCDNIQLKITIFGCGFISFKGIYAAGQLNQSSLIKKLRIQHRL